MELYQQKIIESLNEQLERYPIILEENEELLSIIFSSVDEKKKYSMICKNTDKICDLEEKIYKEYPDFDSSYKYILYKGKEINRFQTIEYNRIKNGDVVILNQKID